MPERTARPSDELMLRIRRAFLDRGYAKLSMTEIATACGFTRRSLYHYFSNKEQVFRSVIEFNNRTTMDAGLAAGDEVRKSGGSALEIVAEIMNVRYGNLRREVNVSPHVLELNAETSRRAADVMVAYAERFHLRLTELLTDLEANGLLRLNSGKTAADVAELLAAGARGVNQSLPPVPPDQLAARYRAMCEAVLFGCTDA